MQCRLITAVLFATLERQVCREKVGEMLGEKIMYIAETLNRHEYVPKMPNQSELDLVFDTTFSDVQPYLYKVCLGENKLSNFSFNVKFRNSWMC